MTNGQKQILSGRATRRERDLNTLQQFAGAWNNPGFSLIAAMSQANQKTSPKPLLGSRNLFYGPIFAQASSNSFLFLGC